MRSPARSTRASSPRVRFNSLWRPRATNTVPASALNGPISGQARTSDLATKRDGKRALMTKTSTQEVWFATSSAFGSTASPLHFDRHAEGAQHALRPALDVAHPRRRADPREHHQASHQASQNMQDYA